MTTKTYIADSGGTARFVKKILVADSGGVARAAKKVYVADAGGVARQVYGAGYAGSMVAGVNGFLIGYAQSSYGSIAPTTDNQGNTVSTVASDVTHTTFYLAITGVSSAPPANYFTTMSINGTPLLASAATYNTAGNQAQWTWTPETISLTNGNTYPVSYD